MFRKILGILFLVAAALVLIGSIATGSLMSDRGSAAATYGAFTGTMLAVVLYVLAGVFLLRFDGVYQKSRMEGYRIRARQCTFILLFVFAFLILMLMAGIVTGLAALENFILSYLLAALPHFVPLVIFAMFTGVYVIPFQNCRKRIPMDDTALQAHFADVNAFAPLTDDGSVLASNEALFFPQIFCLVPFAQISSVKFYNVIEQDVIFTLTSGKKLVLVSSKKQFEAVQAAIEARKQ